MPTTESLHLAAQLEVASDSRIVEDPEAVDDRDRPSGLLDDPLRFEIEVGLVRNRENQCLRIRERAREILLDAEIEETLLVTEEARE